MNQFNIDKIIIDSFSQVTMIYTACVHHTAKGKCTKNYENGLVPSGNVALKSLHLASNLLARLHNANKKCLPIVNIIAIH